jgi:hypothetical protein
MCVLDKEFLRTLVQLKGKRHEKAMGRDRFGFDDWRSAWAGGCVGGGGVCHQNTTNLCQ